MTARSILLPGVLAALAVPAAAQDGGSTSYSFAELAAACDSADEAYQQGLCEGFILGTGGLYLELRRAGAIEPWACAQDAPSVTRIRESVVDWAADHPEIAGTRAVDGFWRAMADLHPCSSQ